MRECALPAVALFDVFPFCILGLSLHPMPHTLFDRPYLGIAAVLLAVSGSVACSRAPVEQIDPVASGTNRPLSSYNQLIQSSAANLSVSANESFNLPVRIENPGTDTWDSTGGAPVTVSYKWFLKNNMLPIEGERTVLPKPIGPKQSADVTVHVIAPGQPGKYELRVTLVQEGVAWFMTKSNTYLALPVTVR
jgi:hypothetical protein